jgi:5-formyltetrahydrofolate cyclo-ligase
VISRDELVRKRKALSTEEISKLSAAVLLNFNSQAAFLSGSAKRNIALYRSMPREIDLSLLEKQYRGLGHRLHFPRVKDRDKKAIEFVEVGPKDTFQAGPYNIQEPHPELKAVDPSVLDIIIVPGVGFGPNGERIGMGAGYYDRFLPHAPQALRIALAFDFQLLPRLDQKPWDQPVHWIVTESREMKTPAAHDWFKLHGFSK